MWSIFQKTYNMHTLFDIIFQCAGLNSHLLTTVTPFIINLYHNKCVPCLWKPEKPSAQFCSLNRHNRHPALAFPVHWIGLWVFSNPLHLLLTSCSWTTSSLWHSWRNHNYWRCTLSDIPSKPYSWFEFLVDNVDLKGCVNEFGWVLGHQECIKKESLLRFSMQKTKFGDRWWRVSEILWVWLPMSTFKQIPHTMIGFQHWQREAQSVLLQSDHHVR